MHFNTRTAEEYINKINRGFLGKEFILYDKRIKDFFIEINSLKRS